MVGQTNGEIDGWTDKWMNGWTDGHIHGWTNERMKMDGQMDGWMDGWMQSNIYNTQHYLSMNTLAQCNKLDSKGKSRMYFHL